MDMDIHTNAPSHCMKCCLMIQAVHEMDGARFLKLCRDCQLTDKQLSTTDVDLVFAKVKSKGQRRISFKQFLTALAMISDKKVRVQQDERCRQITLIVTTV